jgi:hypothetical protein
VPANQVVEVCFRIETHGRAPSDLLRRPGEASESRLVRRRFEGSMVQTRSSRPDPPRSQGEAADVDRLPTPPGPQTTTSFPARAFDIASWTSRELLRQRLGNARRPGFGEFSTTAAQAQAAASGGDGTPLERRLNDSRAQSRSRVVRSARGLDLREGGTGGPRSVSSRIQFMMARAGRGRCAPRVPLNSTASTTAISSGAATIAIRTEFLSQS